MGPRSLCPHLRRCHSGPATTWTVSRPVVPPRRQPEQPGEVMAPEYVSLAGGFPQPPLALTRWSEPCQPSQCHPVRPYPTCPPLQCAVSHRVRPHTWPFSWWPRCPHALAPRTPLPALLPGQSFLPPSLLPSAQFLTGTHQLGGRSFVSYQTRSPTKPRTLFCAHRCIHSTWHVPRGYLLDEWMLGGFPFCMGLTFGLTFTARNVLMDTLVGVSPRPRLLTPASHLQRVYQDVSGLLRAGGLGRVQGTAVITAHHPRAPPSAQSRQWSGVVSCPPRGFGSFCASFLERPPDPSNCSPHGPHPARLR